MSEVKQKSEYTFKYNLKFGRHGWLRLTPAYSVKMVEEVLSSLSYTPELVFEPFSGTGTTELVCANKGIKSYAYDINPFLVWVASVKTRVYKNEDIDLFKRTIIDVINKIDNCEESIYPPIYNIERWWNKRQLSFLARMKTAIWEVDNSVVRDLLKMAFCRELIAISNASFNHVSTSFKDDIQEDLFTEKYGKELFIEICEMLAQTAQNNPKQEAVIINRNSIEIHQELKQKYDTLITSPPYPNRISYIRELRPYMYWLDYINTSDDASDLDWNTIGGTWGAATSRLADWNLKTDILPEYLFDITEKISKADNKSAGLMANYVLKYFDDIAIHLASVKDTIVEGGTVHYIVGNSNFYGNTVPSDRIYVDLLTMLGLKNAKAEIVRKRNCNKALYEYWISAER